MQIWEGIGCSYRVVKEIKANQKKVEKSFEMIPLLEYLETNLFTKPFKIMSGRYDIDEDKDVENTREGNMLADGFTEEISTANDNSRSRGGSFKLKHIWIMLVTLWDPYLIARESN